ncbi:hypothetical protein [Psychrobacter sp. ANT_WB68]|uniref:hypothetical protein n=1 Tax=Psychrobacter sp. ANT_WB68 TaxID=2597355 RepID=UPI0011F21124|nr:hypothetical protein [Psychrobacter sp. ANT_WB68]KAA0914569.1 hypothetical protein FQ084_08430 [Psychrobacter sp. ANT_WB68]
MDFSVNKSSTSLIVRKVEDVLIHSRKFDLPRKLPQGKPEDTNRTAVIIDANETQIERLKNKASTIAEKRSIIL